MNQPTNAPTHKAAAAGVAGSLTILLVYVAGEFGLDIPPEVGAAAATLIAFAAAYIKRERG